MVAVTVMGTGRRKMVKQEIIVSAQSAGMGGALLWAMSPVAQHGRRERGRTEKAGGASNTNLDQITPDEIKIKMPNKNRQCTHNGHAYNKPLIWHITTALRTIRAWLTLQVGRLPHRKS